MYCLCSSFLPRVRLPTLFPCSRVWFFPWDIVLHELLQYESFPWAAVYCELLQLGFPMESQVLLANLLQREFPMESQPPSGIHKFQCGVLPKGSKLTLPWTSKVVTMSSLLLTTANLLIIKHFAKVHSVSDIHPVTVPWMHHMRFCHPWLPTVRKYPQLLGTFKADFFLLKNSRIVQAPWFV